MKTITLAKTAVAAAIAGVPLAASAVQLEDYLIACLLYTSPSPRDATLSRMPSSA